MALFPRSCPAHSGAPAPKPQDVAPRSRPHRSRRTSRRARARVEPRPRPHRTTDAQNRRSPRGRRDPAPTPPRLEAP
ncbi:hypothetical protein HMPREF9404_5446 [Eggerthella sp. HGA1]|nr:hypothetical protein HMPREF9404_5446 [Eggerthella sp. HGA1]